MGRDGSGLPLFYPYTTPDGIPITISYLYDASGTKLKKTAGTVSSYYQGSVLKLNGVDIVMTGEGRAVKNGTWSYEYDLRDHLGNTRVSFTTLNGKAQPMQYRDYYPFGLEMARPYPNDPTATKYRYNGKELQDEGGLGWYDYGARFYDPCLGRWHTPDVLGELRYEESPFCYVGINPMSRVDPDGRIWDTILDAAFTLYDAGEAAYQYATTGAVSTTTKAALAADALAIIIPGVTGAGIGVRIAAHAEDAVRAADKAVDAVKAIDKVVEGEKTIDKAVDGAKAINGNSKASTKAQHNYDVIDTWDNNRVVKTGTSGGKETKVGESYRGNSQANKWNKQEGTPGRYKSETTNRVPAGEGARQKALNYEKSRADQVREQLDPRKHQRP